VAKPNAWMPLYIGDYLRKTMRLTTVQHGAYLLLLMAYWQDGPLPDDDAQLAAIAKMDEKAWAKIAPTVRAFFRADGSVLRHEGADGRKKEAVEKYEKRSKAGAQNVRARYQKPTNGKTDTLPNGDQSQSQQHSSKDDSVAKATGAGAPFEGGDGDLKSRIFGPALEWLARAVHKEPRAMRAIVGKWCSQHGDGRTLEALQHASRNAPLDPVPYIEKLLQSPRAGPPGQPQFKNAFAQLRLESSHEPDRDHE
jgi:uncharacterized protein YdaU (DUF1376 family)